MKKTISKLLIFIAVLSVAVACKHNKQEDPAPVQTVKAAKDEIHWPLSFMRYRDRNNGNHFYTVGYPDQHYFQWEGVLCGSFASVAHANERSFNGALPLHRYFNRLNGDHFYTINFNELGNGNAAFVYEGIETYVFANIGNNDPSQLMPIYRYYNPFYGVHFYTNDASELSGKNSGFNYEGIGFYGVINNYTIPGLSLPTVK